MRFMLRFVILVGAVARLDAVLKTALVAQDLDGEAGMRESDEEAGKATRFPVCVHLPLHLEWKDMAMFHSNLARLIQPMQEFRQTGGLIVLENPTNVLPLKNWVSALTLGPGEWSFLEEEQFVKDQGRIHCEKDIIAPKADFFADIPKIRSVLYEKKVDKEDSKQDHGIDTVTPVPTPQISALRQQDDSRLCYLNHEEWGKANVHLSNDELMELAKSMGYSETAIATYNTSLTADARQALIFLRRCNVLAGTSSESLGAGYLLSNPGTKAIHITPYETNSQITKTVEKIAKAVGMDYHTLPPVPSLGIHLRTDADNLDDLGVKNAVCAFGIDQLISNGTKIVPNADFFDSIFFGNQDFHVDMEEFKRLLAPTAHQKEDRVGASFHEYAFDKDKEAAFAGEKARLATAVSSRMEQLRVDEMRSYCKKTLAAQEQSA